MQLVFYILLTIRIRKKREERLKEQELKMKEKQEKLKEEEQRIPAVEISVGYDTYYYCDVYHITLFSFMARPYMCSFIYLIIYKGIF